jgi:hypothetical protein
MKKALYGNDMPKMWGPDDAGIVLNIRGVQTKDEINDYL